MIGWSIIGKHIYLKDLALAGSFCVLILNFVRSGYFNLTVTTGTLRIASQNGYEWSSRPYSSITNTYFLRFDAGIVNPSSYGSRHYGFPLRCLSTVLDYVET